MSRKRTIGECIHDWFESIYWLMSQPELWLAIVTSLLLFVALQEFDRASREEQAWKADVTLKLDTLIGMAKK